MDCFVIRGGRPLRGRVRVSGSKNAALPILVASLLTDEPCTARDVPRLRDIRTTVRLLENLGKRVEQRGHEVRVLPGRPLKTRAPYDIVKQMRASVLVAGPLLARFGRVRVPLPGGCAIGLRPIDIHMKAFEEMGARLSTVEGDVVLDTAALAPGTLRFRFPSVGATENVMLAAAGLDGLTRIHGAAREPEISDLAAALERMGARVAGAGTSTLSVRGSARLGGYDHRVIPDRIETGTFLIACAAAGGKIVLDGAWGGHLGAVLEALEKAGARVKSTARGIAIGMEGRPRPVSARTLPYPGFPTDLQAPWMALMCLARGRSVIRETVFENRFIHAAELSRMGASLAVRGGTATVTGVETLNGAPIMASDIRAGAALLVAGVAARGRTVLQRVYHIDRGYERVEAKLRRLGVSISRINR